MAHAGRDAFGLLQELDQLARSRKRVLPVREEPRREWLGVGFKVGTHTLIAAMDQVAEVVGVPALARIPGVKPWVLGLANLRGRLIPVMDLYGFLYGVERRGSDASSRRVIVIDTEGIVAGLIVDGVAGMRHFWVDEQVGPPPALDEALREYVESAFPVPDGLVGVFDFSRLARSEAFLDVAL